ncbi:hypothetical protein MPTA5024_02790 [Microbispora sp. ATCC PTA-5024]|nr:hypothetical protein MPTA5024_02790 [Microbispora sp. ATCC PTA-5024]
MATEAASSHAVSTQVTALWVVCRSCWIVGSAGPTSDCNIENAPVAADNTRNVGRVEAREGEGTTVDAIEVLSDRK